MVRKCPSGLLDWDGDEFMCEEGVVVSKYADRICCVEGSLPGHVSLSDGDGDFAAFMRSRPEAEWDSLYERYLEAKSDDDRFVCVPEFKSWYDAHWRHKRDRLRRVKRRSVR